MSTPGASDKTVILDRDGTLVIDRGYLADPDGLEFEPGAAEGLRWLHSHGFQLIVITNQSGVGRGFFPLERLEAQNVRLRDMVENAGARLAGLYFCPHAPDAACLCRKPSLGLMHRAASDLGFAPASAIVIGDKDSDIEFGQRAGARTILIATAGGAPPLTGRRVVPDLVATDLMEAARAVTSGSV